MNKVIAFTCLAVALVLFTFGFEAYHSPVSNLSQALTGAPTNQALWLIIGGVLASITGIFGLATDSSK